MQHRSEWLVPWLAGAAFIALVQVGLARTGVRQSFADTAVMFVALASSLGLAVLVAARASRAADAAELEERNRPTVDELSAAGSSMSTSEPWSPNYVKSMERWAAAMLELTEHALSLPAAAGAELTDDLTGAADDTRELRQLLELASESPIDGAETRILYTLCVLWEAAQSRVEQLAAGLDPQWHRQWAASYVVERLARRGVPLLDTTVLPYRV